MFRLLRAIGLHKSFLPLMLFCFNVLLAEEYSIVFIHIGEVIPAYADEALVQARAFNKECPIILLADEKALSAFRCSDPLANITYIARETLEKSEAHKRFIANSSLDQQWRDGFWRYTSERFLYLDDLMSQHHLTHVFHMEYDNMLYVNLQDLLPIFKQQYKGIAATFCSDKLCVPGFLFISNEQVMHRLAECFAAHASKGEDDMRLLGIFKEENGFESIDHLPIIHKEYAKKYRLKNAIGIKVKDKRKYFQNIELFQSIFDGAALGQYLGGPDPKNGPSKPGHIDTRTVFNASKLTFSWKEDLEGRKIPYATFKGATYRINNLHIHSKRLELFRS